YDVPHLENMVIDGRADDWGSGGFAVNTLIEVGGKLRPANDFDATVRLGWNEKGLLVLARVQDHEAHEAKDDNLWQGDSIELFMANGRGAKDICQISIAPGTTPAQPELRSKVTRHYKTAELQNVGASAVVARTRTANSYLVEALLPWDNLRIMPAVGHEISFQIYINDSDGDSSERTQTLWYGESGAHGDSRKMQRLRLALKPGAPVNVAVEGKYERFRRTRVNIVTTGDMAGQTVELREGKKVLGTARLVADIGRPAPGRATASITLPMPQPGQTYGHMEVVSRGITRAHLELPDARELRRRAFNAAALLFQPSVFSSETFPPIEFEQPSLVEDLIGEYSIQTTFYNRDYDVVKAPTKPDRYGAIAEIRAANGAKYKRFLTLYRQPEAVDWGNLDFSAPSALPAGWGIDPVIIREQEKLLGGEFKWMLSDNTRRRHSWAKLLAGLTETRSGDGTAYRNDVWARDRDWWYGLKKKTGDLVPYRHLLQVPDGYEANAQKKWPVLLFLHGSGERGDDLERVKVHGPPRLIEEGKKLPFIVVSPQCPSGERWSPLQLGDLLDDVAARYRVDASRIYVTGLSLGGYATWDLAMQYPDRFAAIAPICGSGDAALAPLIKDVPSWIFHGAKDTAVLLEEGQKMADAMKQAGAEVKFTVYPEAGHDSWTESYNNPLLYEWLLQHSKR
ncbi:MAG TPA: sugar-binding protein, partial [Abditibacteriaceae bacterium]